VQRKLKFAVVVAVVVSVTAPAMAGGNANFLLGYRQFSDDEIEDFEVDALDGQPVVGVSVDFHTGDLPFNWVAGMYLSSREEEETIPFFGDVDVEVSFTEIDFGILKKWESETTRPFVGGGLTYVEGEIEFSAGGQSDSEDDNVAAIFGEGGVYWRLGGAFNIGIGGRLVFGADLEVEDLDVDGDYVQVGLLLGWGWDN
jgi:hypothetical protein